MTFDEKFESEARALFDRRAQIEITHGGAWVPCDDEEFIQLVFADRSRACYLAHSGGVRLTDGRSVRFRAPPNTQAQPSREAASAGAHC